MKYLILIGICILLVGCNDRNQLEPNCQHTEIHSDHKAVIYGVKTNASMFDNTTQMCCCTKDFQGSMVCYCNDKNS